MIGVLIRVFNRLDDLKICVQTVRKYWRADEYHLVVVSNGAATGSPVPSEVHAQVDRVVELEQNAGHLEGTAQLLSAGVPYLPDACRYSVLLEADTWVFTDRTIHDYLPRLESRGAVWASAEWVERYWSLGIDFAIAETAYLKANPALFRFRAHAEAWIADYLLIHRQRFLYLREHMPVHCPKSLRFIGQKYTYGGRFRCFPKARTVTHHLEDLDHGLDSKKLWANICLARREFPLGDPRVIASEHRRLQAFMTLATHVPRSRWLRSKQRQEFPEGGDRQE
jgi:hypothetical protein